ncbi:hypothetical protein [Pedobacter sp. Leaf170]|uniref:hypothetical protein n=1 Tax=Pedobacter sp. Leaf170 TaxID=2876558 RepID=UPI001E3C91B1|nr:hypothetical protein [Pedobacter sp. Leaf170]
MEITATTTKSYGSAKVGKWDLKYEWESQNGAKPTGVKITGNDGKSGFINCDFSENNKNISFGGAAEFDLDVAASIVESVANINNSFETTQD